MTPWTVAGQAPLSMGFSRKEYWNGLPCPSPEIEPRSPPLQADSLPSELPGKPRDIYIYIYIYIYTHIYMCVCVCLCIANSLCYTVETNNIVKQLYSNKD